MPFQTNLVRVCALPTTQQRKTGISTLINIADMTAREAAATRIFEGGHFLIDTEVGFPLAIHQDLPKAPRSPFYLNLRPEGVKEGKMTQMDIDAVAMSMLELGKEQGLFWTNRSVCDIPQAGTPFLDSIMICYPGDPKRFFLQKQMIDEVRSFAIQGNLPEYANQALLIDDLVASSLTKKLAIRAIQKAGGKVTDLLVFLNRSADAYQDLAKLEVTLHPVFEFDHLIEWALANQHLNREQHEAIVEYPLQLEAYKKSVGYN